MEFTSETGKVPKDYGYVLKPSTIEDALNAAGVEIAVHLVRNHSKCLFMADFWPPNLNIAYERLHITIGTARMPLLMELRQRAELEALPELVRWICRIMTLDPKSPIRWQKQNIQLLPVRDD